MNSGCPAAPPVISDVERRVALALARWAGDNAALVRAHREAFDIAAG